MATVADGGRTSKSRLVIGSRKSKLALWQSHHVADQFRAHFPTLDVAIETYSTRGDEIIDRPLPEIGGKGLFTAELDRAIATGEIDLAIHSLKDLPTEPTAGIVTIPILKCADVRDALVSRNKTPLSELRPNAIVGTSSPRRTAQLLAIRSDLIVKPIRGNVPTRIGKLDTEDYDAIILAAAGIKRLGLEAHVTQWFEPDEMLPAPGQGVLAATCRADDTETIEMIRTLEDITTSQCVAAERGFLSRMGGGCSMPVGAHASCTEDSLTLTGRVVSLDGQSVLTHSATAPLNGSATSQTLAATVADALFEQGAQKILDSTATPDEPQLQSKRLAGKRVVVTRANTQAEELANQLTARGAQPTIVPLIEFAASHDADETKTILSGLTGFDWILFTSSNGIRYFFELLGDQEVPQTVRLACVGQKSAATLAEFGHTADFVPHQFSSRDLAKEIPIAAGQKILYPSPTKIASGDLIESLQHAGAEVRRWVIYETKQLPLSEQGKAAIESADAITFASPSAVDSLCQQWPEFPTSLKNCVVACIGPMSKRKAEEWSIEVAITPEHEYTMDGLVTSLNRYFEQTKKIGEELTNE